jgi:hypothetical protein
MKGETAMSEPEYTPPAKLSDGAVVALILALIPCLAPVGIIASIVALYRIRKSGGALRGRKYAQAALVLGILITLSLPLIAFAMAVNINKHVGQSKCVGHMLYEIGGAIREYSTANNGYYPYDERGGEYSLSLLYPEYCDPSPDAFVCPGHYFPTPLFGKQTDETNLFPPDCSLAGRGCSYDYVFTPPDRATPDTIILADRRGNHGKDGGNVLFYDGRIERVKHLPDLGQ